MKIRKILYSLLFVPMLLLPACEPFDLKQDDIQLSVDFSIFKTYISVTYYDGATGQIIGISGDADLQIDFTSSVPDLIVNTEGKFQNSLNSNFGFFTLALNPYLTPPSANNPVYITITTRSGTYLEDVRTIKISEERSLTYDFDLINMVTPPSGVTVESHGDIGTTSSTGETKDSINLTTENGAVEVTIESGAVLTDDTGEPLTGTLSVQMVTIDVSDTEGFRNIPGLDQPIVKEDGSTSAMMTPIAYTKVEISDASGKKATSVSGKEMVITTALSPGTMNPSAGRKIAAGDMVPCYWFDGKSGKWKFSGNDPVEDRDGNLVIKKVLRPLKSAGDGNVGQFAYSFDREQPKDLLINWTLNADASLPTQVEISLRVGDRVDNFKVLLDSYAGEFWVYGLPATFGSSDELIIRFGQETLVDELLWNLDTGAATYVLNVNLEIEPQGGGDTQTTWVVTFRLNICDDVVIDGSGLPNFTAIMSGPGFDGETLRLISGGTLVLPFNPMTTDGTWQTKIIFNNTYEYPAGSGRISVTKDNFHFEGEGVTQTIVFEYQVTDSQGCADLKEALGIGG